MMKMLKNIWPVWAVYTLLHRLQYKFRALHAGVLLNSQATNLHNMRRNIHRIEKGLSYENARPVFAEQYIEATVQAYVDLRAELDADTTQWAEAVLTRYFEHCDDTAIVAAAQAQFEAVQPDNATPNHAPYPESDRPGTDITFAQMQRLAVQRRSVRYFTDQVVEPEVVAQAMEVARMSPSACNRQSFRFLFYNKPEVVQALSAVPGGVAGYTLPSVIVIVGRYSGYFDERDVNVPIIDASLATMSFQFAAETLGLGTVAINWPNLPDREQRIREIITLEPDEFVIMMMGVGYPKSTGVIPYSGKKSVGELLQVNQRIR